MARKDITFGEPFHRTKQTLLIFCSAILVTRIPGIDVTGSTGILGVSLRNVNIDHIRWGLLAAATYYFIGFLLEALAERHSNTGTSRFGTSETLGDELKNVADQIRNSVSSGGFYEQQWREAVTGLERAARTFSENLHGIRMMSTPNENGGRQFVSEQVLRGYEQASETLPALFSEAVSQVEEATSYYTRSADKTEEIVTMLRADVRGLASDIRWWKRLQFYGWDVIGATVMFGLAVYFSTVPF
ncbi:hypothetical protein [Brevundimonas sp. NPDC058933]|uniref:hypothetical protein n=1 Tax=Brevundimonas sp. NPDC058933 TaxID=3346673 RepID=UPI003BEF1E8A